MNQVQCVKKTMMLPILFVLWLANTIAIKTSKKTGRKLPPTMIPLFWGGVGIGKSMMMSRFIEYHAQHFPSASPFFCDKVLKLNLSSMDGGDFEMPVADHGAGGIKFYGAIPFTKERQVILADEMNRYLTNDTINAFSRIFLDRDGASKPTEGSFVVGASNMSSSLGTKDIPEHVLDRACHIYLTEKGCHDDNIQYLREVSDGQIPSWMVETFDMNEIVSRDDHQEMAGESPRSREYATWIAIAAESAATFGIEVSDQMLFAMLAGVCGQATAYKLMAQRKMAALPKLGDVLASPATVQIPSNNVDHGLRKNHALKLISEVAVPRDASLLLSYFLRFEGEFQRYAIEALAEKVPAVKDHHLYKGWQQGR